MNNDMSKVTGDLPVISVIIPVYNVEKFLPRCINSVLNQTYSNIEVILIDDGSKDSSGEICDEFANKHSNIRVIHKENGGLSSARNSGLDVAKGKYYAFVDSDDWIRPQMITVLYNLIIENNCDVASCKYEFCKDESEKEIQTDNTPLILEGEDIIEFYMHSSFSNTIGEYPVWNKLYNAELFNDIRFPVGVTYEDMIPTFHILQKAKRFIKTQTSLYCYFVNPGSITRGHLKAKDFYLLNVCDIFIEESEKFSNKNILKYAKLKKYRTYYSLLAKGLIYGVDSDVTDYKSEEKKMLSLLRQHKSQLLESDMEWKRKLIIRLICLNPNIVKNIGKLINGR